MSEPCAPPLTGAAAQCGLSVVSLGESGVAARVRPWVPAVALFPGLMGPQCFGSWRGSFCPPLLGPDRRLGRTACLGTVGVLVCRGFGPGTALGRLERHPPGLTLGRRGAVVQPMPVGFGLPWGRLRGWSLAGPPLPQVAVAGGGGPRGIFGWSAALGLAVVLAGCHFALAWVPSPVGSGRKHTSSCCTCVPPPRRLDSSACGWYIGGPSDAVWCGRH
ncbi:hypothetical protein NDU88_006291 [Pleurodeles waltl]|uniref:Uncharacterized protein n=1 Tax=Pleurodeles waltl TaxID=8319 RepID=A0AAV7TDI2_PLEWA|nr:hypothetical protein NDU88_006291 [Pleurodeles waltl]